MNIYVGNLHYNLGDEDLKQVFEEYGEVVSSKIIKDRETGRSKGFGFIEMSEDSQANEAIEELNGAELMGRTMRVNESKPRTNNNRGGGFDRRRREY